MAFPSTISFQWNILVIHTIANTRNMHISTFVAVLSLSSILLVSWDNEEAGRFFLASSAETALASRAGSFHSMFWTQSNWAVLLMKPSQDSHADAETQGLYFGRSLSSLSKSIFAEDGTTIGGADTCRSGQPYIVK